MNRRVASRPPEATFAQTPGHPRRAARWACGGGGGVGWGGGWGGGGGEGGRGAGARIGPAGGVAGAPRHIRLALVELAAIGRISEPIAAVGMRHDVVR